LFYQKKNTTVSYAAITLPERIDFELPVPNLGFETNFQISGFTEQTEIFDESWDSARYSKNSKNFIS